MNQAISIVFLLTALLSYVNYRWLKLPTTIGLMVLSFALTILIILSEVLFPGLYRFFCQVVLDLDFKYLLLDVMLSFLLFAGALHVNIQKLAREKWSVLLFASLGVLISTVVVGLGTFYLAQVIGVELTLIQSFLFGALISPTDPIAVIAILKEAGVSERLEMKIEGESLFNDGVGVVVFSGILLLTEVDMHGEGSIVLEIGKLFLEEAIGGLAFGALLGFVGYGLIKSVRENAQLCVILSLAMAMGGYALASMLHVSGPLAMVVAGLIIGNKLHIADHDHTENSMMNEIWEMLDEILNGILFVLIGLSIYVLEFNISYLLLGLLAILIVLAGRFISVRIPYGLLKHDEHSPQKTVQVLTWGGLRGGISLALAMSLSEENAGTILVFITYVVVFFSILVQGLSLGKFVKWVYRDGE